MADPARPPLLCSGSPRRVELLLAAGVPFERGAAPDVDETPPAGVEVHDVARALAERKARAAAARAPGATVICADTTVVLGGELLGKPRDPADAAAMLRRLAGREHVVVTGVAVARGDDLASGADRAVVAFRPIAEAEVAAYVATGEPLDKAGAYAIQGGAARFVVRVAGRVDTIVGLPVPLVVDLLARLGRSDRAVPPRSPPFPSPDRGAGGC